VIAASGIKVALAITVRRDTVASVKDLEDDLDDFTRKPPAAWIPYREEHCIKTVYHDGSKRQKDYILTSAQMSVPAPVNCLILLAGIFAVGAAGQDTLDPNEAETQLRALGALIDKDLRTHEVIEVRLNNKSLTDNDLRWLVPLQRIRDLSLENTPIGDVALAPISRLDHLEWLNLYQTKVSDIGLKHLVRLRTLHELHVGRTSVTDEGLRTIRQMTQLVVLGLRDTRVTDAGLPSLAALTSLESLNLSETSVSRKGLETLRALPALRTLWLNRTPLDDSDVPTLEQLTSLLEIHLTGTRVTRGGIDRLRDAKPRRRVIVDDP